MSIEVCLDVWGYHSVLAVSAYQDVVLGIDLKYAVKIVYNIYIQNVHANPT
jgi:hypothetical protein